MIGAVDPGSRWWGWCRLDGWTGVGGVLDARDHAGSPIAALRTLLAGVDELTIEEPRGLPPGMVRTRPAAAVTASAELARASWLAGELFAHAARDGLLVRRATAAQVRRHFFGVENADDDAVEALVRQRVPALSLPRSQGGAYGVRGGLLAERCAHVLDAVAAALWAREVRA